MKKFTQDIFEPNLKFEVEEASGDVDGKHILAKVKGSFFVPNGVSRNNRFYSEGLWKKVVSNPSIIKKLTERRMFGSIGHNQKLGDDALLEGKTSHIVTGLNIVNGQGIGEALILNTPAGRILNTILRAGSKMFVSSRADGSFNGEENGIPKVDEDSYQLDTFDFVVDPGFLEANPNLVEQFKKIESLNNNEGDYMEPSTQLMEKLAKENGTLRSDLERATSEVVDLRNKNTVMISENDALKSKLDKQSFAEKQLAKYRSLGTPEEIEKVLDMAEGKLNVYKEFGSVKELGLALDRANDLIERYKVLGTPKEINEALDKSIAVVTAYKDLGSPVELKMAMDKFEEKINKINSDKAVVKIAELAKDLKVSEDKIRMLWGKISEAEIRKVYSSSSETVSTTRSNPSRTYARGSKSSSVGVKTTETESGFSRFKRPLGAQLMEQFCAPAPDAGPKNEPKR